MVLAASSLFRLFENFGQRRREAVAPSRLLKDDMEQFDSFEKILVSLIADELADTCVRMGYLSMDWPSCAFGSESVSFHFFQFRSGSSSSSFSCRELLVYVDAWKWMRSCCSHDGSESAS